MPLFDPIRQRWVADTAEERVRQRTLRWLLQADYPPSWLIVERTLPLARSSRRLDIACMAPGTLTHPGPLYLLIECKAGQLSQAQLQRAQNQVMGYQWHLGAHAVAIIDEQSSSYCLAREPGYWQEGLLTFTQLRAALALE